ELVLGGVVVRKDAPDPEKEVDRAAAWVAEEGAASGVDGDWEPGRSDECVGIQDAGEDDVEEEALDPVLVGREVTVLEVGRADAPVVRAVPGTPGPHRTDGAHIAC